MEDNENVLRFDPSAYLQRLLGRELISSEQVAVAELVKNTYDAGATEVVITFYPNEPQSMTIADNGKGMSLGDFKKFWMTPGYSEKQEMPANSGRPLLGEKGIGRFAADKLATKLRVITKLSGEVDALEVKFDWSDFNDRSKLLRDVPIPYFRIDFPGLNRNQSGTILELTNLREVWTSSSWRKLRRELQNLILPYQSIRDFKIIAIADGWESGKVTSLFQAQTGYRYAFSINKGGRIRREISRPKSTANRLNKPQQEIIKSYFGSPKFGPIKGSFYYVDQVGPLRKKGFEPGVALYRDGFRVESFGREYDDWLDVKSRKASRHGHAPINPTRLFGFIEISHSDNPNLLDVTNREGLVDNLEFREFREFVEEEFKKLSKIVEEEKQLLEDHSAAYSAQKESNALEVKRTTFTEIADQLAHQLRQPLQVIRSEAGSIETLLKKVKQFEDPDLKSAITNINSAVDKINDHVTFFRRRALSSRAPITQSDLCTWLRDKVNESQAPAFKQGITITLDVVQEPIVAVFSREAIGFVFENLINNAINACSRVDSRPRQIVVSLSTMTEYDFQISIYDNGPGVPEVIRGRIFREIVPSETDGTGSGLKHSYDFIREYGGFVTYEPGENYGSTFHIQFNNKELPDEREGHDH